MKFIGLDLGGVNSIASVRDATGIETLNPSAFPEKLSVILLPLIRKERLLAGDEAFRSERESGLLWPPLARAAPDGWSRATPPSTGGRMLLATVWQRLIEGGQWSEPQWQPPDGLPPINKPVPADCMTAAARAVLKRSLHDGNDASVVLAIPNQLPEEAQDALLSRLPGTRLVWRSVAAAILWAESIDRNANPIARLTVLDAGLYGVESSDFEFRRQEVDSRVFLIPVRRLNQVHVVVTGNLLADSQAPFSSPRFELSRLEQHLDAISTSIDQKREFVVCGPLADSLLTLLRRRFPQFLWPAPDANAVARGASLFASRLACGSPTYLDVLPSLELFTLTAEHEPKWLALIPTDCEVAGGQDYEQTFDRRIFIEQGTPRLATWLQRSGENEFRKLTTDLPVQTARNAWVDLHISARSASGFARVRVAPSRGEFDVFGAGHNVLLNWQSMERLARGPQQKWPVELKFGWPACGKLYANRRFFNEFLRGGTDVETAFMLGHTQQRFLWLGSQQRVVRQTIAPHLAGIKGEASDTAPANLLVCFSTDAPCEFLEVSWSGLPRVTTTLPNEEREAHALARRLWLRLKELDSGRPTAARVEINALIYILGRMGGYAPDAFRDYVAHNLCPTSKGTLLFAAGRVLQTPEHGRHLFATLNDKADLSQWLNNNWLRMLVYILYQRIDVLRDVPRGHVAAAVRLSFDAFERQVQQNNLRVLFMNSLRVLALLLRARRHGQSRDFLCADTHVHADLELASNLHRILVHTKQLRLSPAAKILAERTLGWLEFSATTDEMPPIAPFEEEDEAENGND